jgi:uncharacterized protein YggE
MERTITVKGIGRACAKVDYVEISMTLEALRENYENAMEVAAAQIDEVQRAVTGIGFAKDTVKTTSFNVRTEYKSEHDKNGNYKSVFVGYMVSHHLKLAFDFDAERLGQVLSVISGCKCHPRLSIHFTVKDATAINAEMLRTAAENARQKAEILCAASGAVLGELLSISYNWAELDIYSHTNYDYCEGEQRMMTCKSAIDIQPEAVDVSDGVTFVWEIC